MQKVKQQAAEQVAEEAGQTVDPCWKGEHAHHQQAENDGEMFGHEIIVFDVKEEHAFFRNSQLS